MADPAFRGFVETTLDALLVLEGCRRGFLPKITRRLQEFEKRALVVSGAVFVFHEEETGIKRWTDGLSWSPSRTLDNFLVYRELDKKTAGGRHSDADGDSDASTKPTRSRLVGPLTSKADPVDRALDSDAAPETADDLSQGRARAATSSSSTLTLDRARERALVGSLTSSSRFHADGLVKKTISLSGLHLVSYYRIDDVTSGRLTTPSSHPELMSLEISPSFLAPSLFRLPPVVEVDVDGIVRYKGDAETPLSPTTERSPSPGVPLTGHVLAFDALSRRNSTTQLPDSSRDPSMPQGPRRRAAAPPPRMDHRFSPYEPPRLPPSSAAYPSASAPAQMPPMPTAGSSARPYSSLDSAYPGMPAYQPLGVPLARMPEASSSFSPLHSWQRFQAQVSSPYVPTSAAPDDLPPVPSTFYQPRHSVPNLSTTPMASHEMFSFTPPLSSGSPFGPGPSALRRPPHTSSGYDNGSRFLPTDSLSQGSSAVGSTTRRPQPIQPWLANETARNPYGRDDTGNASPFFTPPTSGDASQSPVTAVDARSRWPTSTPTWARPTLATADLAAHAPADWATASQYGQRGAAVDPVSAMALGSASSEISPHTPASSHLQHQQQQALDQLYEYNGGAPLGPSASTYGQEPLALPASSLAMPGHAYEVAKRPADSYASGLVQPVEQSSYRPVPRPADTDLSAAPLRPVKQETQPPMPVPESRPPSRFSLGPGEAYARPINEHVFPPVPLYRPLAVEAMPPPRPSAAAPPVAGWGSSAPNNVKTEVDGARADEEYSPGTAYKYLPPRETHPAFDPLPQPDGQQWWPNGSPWPQDASATSTLHYPA